MIADTSFLIALSKRDPDARSKLAALEEDGVPVKIPAMAMLEFYIGVGRLDDPEKQARTSELFAQHPFVPMDEEISKRAGLLIGELGATQFKKMKGDVAIAATASVLDEPVVTRNVDDFERLGATVEPY
jgi:predicted nucleic acid-binding protein